MQLDSTSSRQPLPPTVLTIFGITGHLSQTKLLPALYHLLKRGLLPDEFKVVGTSRHDINLDNILQQVEINLLRKYQEADPAVMRRLHEIIRPITMDSTNHSDYEKLGGLLGQIDHEVDARHQRLYYLAIPPAIFQQVITCLHDTGLTDESDGYARRILVEKPFGTNLASAKELVGSMAQIFKETQIYRIDHYLAKENAQNILTFRFDNPVIKDIWHKQSIDNIQITASETGGIDARSNFYESTGALRDLVQSHMLQLMALVMMEDPGTLSSEAIHREKLALLQSVQPIRSHFDQYVVRGQYEGYTDEVDNPSSTTETYVALCLEAANSRWAGVPVLLRTGKALQQPKTEINVVFKDQSNREAPPNILTIRIQPNEGISLRLTAKKPGFGGELQPVNMQFNYQDSFDADSPDAYERVIIDAIAGDQSLFASSDEVIRCWEILEPVLEYWQQEAGKPTLYPKGSWGPAAAAELATSFGTQWL